MHDDDDICVMQNVSVYVIDDLPVKANLAFIFSPLVFLHES